MKPLLQGGAYAGGLAVLVLLVRFALAFYDKACCKEVRLSPSPKRGSLSRWYKYASQKGTMVWGLGMTVSVVQICISKRYKGLGFRNDCLSGTNLHQ